MVINHQALRPREKQRFPLTQTIDIGRVCADACHMCDTNVSRSLGSGHSVQQFIRSQKPVDTLDLARDKRMNTLAHGLQIQHERHIEPRASPSANSWVKRKTSLASRILDAMTSRSTSLMNPWDPSSRSSRAQ